MSTPEARLEALGLALPEPVAPLATYVPFVRVGETVTFSGQISSGPDGLVTGRLGEDMDIEQGRAAARLCALNLIAQFKAAAGGELSRVKQIVRLGGFVSVTPCFTDIPKVINGASDLIVEVFGEAGRHARTAVSCPVLPLHAAVEIDAVAVIEA